MHFSSNIFIKKHGLFICSGTLVDGIYLVTHVTTQAPTLLDTEIMNKSKKLPLKKKAPLFNLTYLWHLRLGHINLNRIQRLVRDGPLGSLVLEPLPTCESCLEGKMIKGQFFAKGQRAKELLELVHSNVYGPINIQARGGYEYFVTFVDDYSRFGYVYLMHRKSDAFDFFREFKTEAEKQTGKSLKALQLDRGGEYLSREFEDYLRHSGIVSQLTAPGTPQQNGVAERRNRTLLDMVRSMMSYSTLPISFGGYALETAMYLLNLAPSKAVPLTPKELWSGRKPSLQHLRI